MKLKLTESQYKVLLREFTEVMVMCTPWKKCMDDPYGEDSNTKWFVGRLEYNDGADGWYPYSEDSALYSTRDEATQAYFDGFYGKNPLMEMRFDGKSTGLFTNEEPQEVNEFFSEKVKNYVGNKKERILTSLDKIIEVSKREKKETAVAAEKFKRLLTKSPPYSTTEERKDDLEYVKSQSMDLLKIVGVIGLGVLSSFIPIVLEKLLNKYNKSILPKSQSEASKEDINTGEDLVESTTKKRDCVPSDYGMVREYIMEIIRGNDTLDGMIDALNKDRSSWTYQDYDNALSSGACEEWNVAVSIVLKSMGVTAYMGTPKDRNLPYHYIAMKDDIIFDFVMGQFWGYGLGNDINDSERVTFTKDEYRDIYDSYDWVKIDNNTVVSESKKSKSTTLCSRGKRAAKAKYDVYPSAYANGYAVQVCKGKIAGLDGKKQCSGKYCSGKKNESWSPELMQDLEAFHNIEIYEDLDVWFGTKKKKKGSKQPQGPWVNICKKKKGGGHPECGRGESDKGGYPVCRAKSVASNMSQEKKDSACRRKRDKEKNDGKSGKGQSPSPIKVKGYEPKKRKSKKNESVNINRMLITESKTIISENLRYHIDNQIPLVENIYRYGSEGYFNLINEVRGIYGKGQLDLSDLDKELIKTDIGKKVMFEGKEVWLDIPMEDNEVLTEAKFKGKTVKTSSPQRSSSGGKAYKVYVSGCVKKTKTNPSGVKLIRFGSGGLRAKLTQPDRKKAYDSRHGCSKGKHNDKCMAGYWSCRLPRYAKKLGLSGGGTWW